MSDSVPNYQADGTENLRASPTFRESPGPQTTPSGGKPVGGTDNLGATTQTFRKAPQSQPTKMQGPPTPQSFKETLPSK